MSTSETSNRSGLLDDAADLLAASRRISAFTGAGISTESGIPDYRGPNGVWARNAVPHIDTIRTDEAARKDMWQERRRRYPEMLARTPNQGHLAIARLEKTGRFLATLTQNIDGLHQKAGSTPERVIELHGSTHRIRCIEYGHVFTGEEIQTRLDSGELDPHCPLCGSVLRTGTVLFGEPLPEKSLRQAFEIAKATDLMLVVGSSLVVNPAARLPVIAREHGARLILINNEPTPLDDQVDIRITASAGAALAGILERLGENSIS